MQMVLHLNHFYKIIFIYMYVYLFVGMYSTRMRVSTKSPGAELTGVWKSFSVGAGN